MVACLLPDIKRSLMPFGNPESLPTSYKLYELPLFLGSEHSQTQLSEDLSNIRCACFALKT